MRIRAVVTIYDGSLAMAAEQAAEDSAVGK